MRYQLELFLTALGFFTRVPVPAWVPWSSERMSHAARYFALVGWVVGAAIISANGKFRVLVAPDPEAEPWPKELQIGGGAKGIALLNNVFLGYELWRIMNGFPPDLYQDVSSPGAQGGKDTGKTKKDPQ